MPGVNKMLPLNAMSVKSASPLTAIFYLLILLYDNSWNQLRFFKYFLINYILWHNWILNWKITLYFNLMYPYHRWGMLYREQVVDNRATLNYLYCFNFSTLFHFPQQFFVKNIDLGRRFVLMLVWPQLNRTTVMIPALDDGSYSTFKGRNIIEVVTPAWQIAADYTTV